MDPFLLMMVYLNGMKEEYKMVMNRVKGNVLGKSYTLSTPEDEAHMQAVFKLVNTQLADLQKQNPSLEQDDALVLIAINALSDQLRMQRKYEEN